MVLKGFFCFRLHTAAVLIGWVGALVSLLNVAMYSVAISKLDTIINALANGTNHSTIDPNGDAVDPVAKSSKLHCYLSQVEEHP